MTKPAKRFTIWTSLVAVTGLLTGGALKAALDTLATRHGWHWGGEVLVLGAFAAWPLIWVCQKMFQGVTTGGWASWR